MPQPLARIFVPPKSAMQSGRARGGRWALEFTPAEGKRLDPLTGWYGSGDTLGQVRLSFESREAAVAWAQAQGLAYEVEDPKPVLVKPKSYAENFRFGRGENWTH
jgi:hypothetical protein